MTALDSWPDRRAQFVYIVGSRREGPLKIGRASAPKSRLSTLQTGNPEPLTVFWCYPCPCGALIEPLIHRILRKHRRQGEWFNVSVEVAMAALWIASNEDDTPTSDETIREWCRHVGLCVECETPHVREPRDPLAAAAEVDVAEKPKFDRTTYQRELMRKRRETPVKPERKDNPK